jgi:hypothetical protein
MLHITAILEDTQLVAVIHDAERATVTVCDSATGVQKTIETTTTALAASLALAVDGNGMDEHEELQGHLYDLAESLTNQTPGNLRIVP